MTRETEPLKIGECGCDHPEPYATRQLGLEQCRNCGVITGTPVIVPASGWAPREHGVPVIPGLHPNARQIIAHTIARRWQELLPDEFNGRPIEGDYTLADKILEALEAASQGRMTTHTD